MDDELVLLVQERNADVERNQNNTLSLPQEVGRNIDQSLPDLQQLQASLRHLDEDNAGLILRQIFAPGFLQRRTNCLWSNFSSFEPAFCVAAGVAAIAIGDGTIEVAAFLTA